MPPGFQTFHKCMGPVFQSPHNVRAQGSKLSRVQCSKVAINVWAQCSHKCMGPVFQSCHKCMGPGFQNFHKCMGPLFESSHICMGLAFQGAGASKLHSSVIYKESAQKVQGSYFAPVIVCQQMSRVPLYASVGVGKVPGQGVLYTYYAWTLNLL